MGDQDDVVDRPHPTSSGKFNRTFSDGAQEPKMIAQITGQEDRRADQRGNHAGDVHPFPVPANRRPSDRDKAGAESVQGRVHRRKIKHIHLTRGYRGETRGKIGWRPERSKAPKSPPFARRDVHGKGTCRPIGKTACGASLQTHALRRWSLGTSAKCRPSIRRSALVIRLRD